MKRLALALLLTVIVVGLLMAFTDLSAGAAMEDSAEAAARLSPLGVVLAFLLYGLSYVGRGVRLALLLPGSAKVPLLVSISARHNLLNLVLPLRSGEASLPLMLRAEAGRSLAEGTAALVVARVLDLLSVATWMLVGLALVHRDADDDLPLRAGLILAGLLLALGLLRPVGRAVARLLAGRKGRLGSFAGRAAGHLAAQPRGVLLLAGLVSLLTWLLTYGSCYVLLHDMGGAGHPVTESLAAVGFPASLVGSSMLHLAGILPINTLAGIGPWEAGWTAGYLLVGVPEDAALASAVVSHGAILLFVSVLGGLGWWRRARPERGVAAPSRVG